MFTHLELADVFKTDTDSPTFKPAAVLRDEDIPAEEPGANRTYTPRVELDKIGEAASLEKRARGTGRTVAARLGIVATEIVEENGERIAKAYDAAGQLVAVRVCNPDADLAKADQLRSLPEGLTRVPPTVPAGVRAIPRIGGAPVPKPAVLPEFSKTFSTEQEE